VQPEVIDVVTMEMMGSRSFSAGTSIQDMAMAPGAPGEHGVNRSSRITVLSNGDGPRTW